MRPLAILFDLGTLFDTPPDLAAALNRVRAEDGYAPLPSPLLAAASQLAVRPAACLYVGDAERDVEAANAAGMRCVIVRYGYRGIDDDSSAWHAAGILDEPRDLLAWL